ncbi:MAG: AI-2E family transporter [Erysipelotrichaceae bacterium]|nr:AI-2E family transporter [Erysipelotrichaceae bacterium]
MKQKKEFHIDFAYAVCWLAIIYVGFQYLLPIFLPFLFGFLFTVASRRVTRNKSMIVLIAMYVILGVLIAFLGVWLFNVLIDYVQQIPVLYRESIEPAINDLYDAFLKVNKQVDFPYLNEIVSSGLSAIRSALLSVGSSLAGLISRSILNLPNILFSLLIFIISSFFFTADYDRVSAFAQRYVARLISFVREKLVAVLAGYGKIIIMTFSELFVGLLILGVRNFPLIAAGTALLDILPIFGCGTVLLPWALLCIIKQNVSRAIGLLVLYVIIYLVRQYVEPRIVAHNLEIPPILSLMSMVVGLRLFGFAGMMGLPLVASYYLYIHPEIMKNENEQ